MIIEEPKLAKNRGLAGKHIARDRQGAGQASASTPSSISRSRRTSRPSSASARSTWTPRRWRRSWAARTPSSGSPTAARTCSSTRTCQQPHAAARLLGAGEADHVARARRAAAHVRLRHRVRHLRPRAAAARAWPRTSSCSIPTPWRRSRKTSCTTSRPTAGACASWPRASTTPSSTARCCSRRASTPASHPGRVLRNARYQMAGA